MSTPHWPRDARDQGPFEASVKCCTFEPFLPNFILGQIIANNQNHDALELALSMGRLTPLGLLPVERTRGRFGSLHDVRCAFLVNGACSIWNLRPSVCRSYFCVSNEGDAGQAIWQRAEELGNQAEWTLAHEVLWELGFTQKEIEIGTWAEWSDRPHDLLVETAKRYLTMFGPSA